MTDPQMNSPTNADRGETAPDDQEQAIRQRAFEISQSEHAGTPEENWERAEREIRGS